MVGAASPPTCESMKNAPPKYRTVEQLVIFDAVLRARRSRYRRLGAVGSLSPDSFRPSRMPVAAALGQEATSDQPFLIRNSIVYSYLRTANRDMPNSSYQCQP